ncbi:MAG: IS1/IS1595 family N-terminal zinc-binding domain-containing protein [Janthinobacterium lividum]
MVIQVIACRHCHSQNVIRHGKDMADRQRFRCHDCHRTFLQQPNPRTHSVAFQQRVLAAYQERASMRGVCRLFGIGRNTLSKWLKKSREPAAAE